MLTTCSCTDFYINSCSLHIAMLSHHNSVTGSITNIIIMMQEQQQHRDIGYTFQFGILRIILTVVGKV